jgi:two-component system, NtrC family, sensor histidine kinase HydH
MERSRVKTARPVRAEGTAAPRPRAHATNGATRRVPETALIEALLDDSESGVLLLDPGARLVEANPAALRILGLALARARATPGNQLIRTVLPGDDPVGNAFREDRVEREAMILSAHGAELPVLLRSYRIGHPPWVLLTLRDLTQSRRMQHELRRHERLATLGQLSAGVAHEIRNPLAGIGTSAQVLLRRFEPRDERARFVRVILDEVERLDRIVTSLLQYARPRVPELKPVSLVPCIERVLELSRESIDQAGIRVEHEVAARLGLVYIDADLITQVLLNVTLNAIQAMPQGGVLRYEVRKVRRRRPPRGPGRRRSDSSADPVPRRRATDTESPGWVEHQQVRVSDTGVGIPRGVLAKLFDPFFSTKPQGTGLGLSISQSIMQEHGGLIEVASREGHGTTVLLNFPVEKRHGERRDDPDAKHAYTARR